MKCDLCQKECMSKSFLTGACDICSKIPAVNRKRKVIVSNISAVLNEEKREVERR